MSFPRVGGSLRCQRNAHRHRHDETDGNHTAHGTLQSVVVRTFRSAVSGRPEGLHYFRYTAFRSTKNSNPLRLFSGRPAPDCLNPPNGIDGSL